jgi:hypothetical protein
MKCSDFFANKRAVTHGKNVALLLKASHLYVNDISDEMIECPEMNFNRKK